jgi:hypothetical protein
MVQRRNLDLSTTHFDGGFEGLNLYANEMGVRLSGEVQWRARIMKGLNLDARRLVQLVRLHVDDIARLTIDTPRMLSTRVFRLWVVRSPIPRKKGKGSGKFKLLEGKTHSERSEGADGVPARILHERARDDLERIGDGAERACLDARHRARTRVQANRDCHFHRAAARYERRVEHDVARDRHRVRQVPVDLIQHVFGRPAQ